MYLKEEINGINTMTCQHCQKRFTAHHGNERYCSPSCRNKAEKRYMRDYQRRRRGTMKTVYRLNKAGNRVFLVLPFRYANIMAVSWVTWFATVQENSGQDGETSLHVTIGAATGDIPVCVTGGQYRVYIENARCEKFNFLSTLRHWGVTYSVRGQEIVACIKIRDESQKKRDGRKTHYRG